MTFTLNNLTGQLLLAHPSSGSTNIFAFPTGPNAVDWPNGVDELWRMKRDGTNNYTDALVISNHATVTVIRQTAFPQYTAVASGDESTTPDEARWLFLAGVSIPLMVGIPLIVIRWFRRLSLGSTD